MQNTEAEPPLRLRAKPLGYDRSHNSYWILTAQETATLFPYNSRGSPVNILDAGSVSSLQEPSVLVKTSAGWWSFYRGSQIEVLLDYISDEHENEFMLKCRMIEVYFHVKSILMQTTLRIKASKHIYFDRRIQSLRWAQESNLIQGPSEDFLCRQIEVAWARCCESLANLHYAHLQDVEDEKARYDYTSERAVKEAMLRRQRKLKEGLQEDCFDHHPQKGWYRVDNILRIREITATTSATFIHCDGTLSSIICSNLNTSTLLKRFEASSLTLDDGDELVVEKNDNSAPTEAEVGPVKSPPPTSDSASAPIAEEKIGTLQ